MRILPDPWRVKCLLDDLQLLAWNGLVRARHLLAPPSLRRELRRNRELHGRHRGARCFVVGNGPSLEKQDIRPLAGEVSFFVNRAFLHPHYARIAPPYHVIVDDKLATGEWPLSFLDEIVARNPGVTLLLNAAWARLPAFRPYREKYRIHWLPLTRHFLPWHRARLKLTRPEVGGAVVEQAIVAAIAMGCAEVNFLGVDGNGLAYTMIRGQSHFYGVNAEDLAMGPEEFSKSFYHASISMRRWINIARYCVRRGIVLRNATDGGIMDVCPRVRLCSLFGGRAGRSRTTRGGQR